MLACYIFHLFLGQLAWLTVYVHCKIYDMDKVANLCGNAVRKVKMSIFHGALHVEYNHHQFALGISQSHNGQELYLLGG